MGFFGAKNQRLVQKAKMLNQMADELKPLIVHEAHMTMPKPFIG